MPLFLNNDDQARAIDGAQAMAAYEAALAQMARGDAVRRPRTDTIIPTGDPGTWLEFSSMEGGQRGGYYALRIKPNLTTVPVIDGKTRLVSFNMRPGNWGGLVFLFDASTAEFVAIMNDGFVQHMRVAVATALGVKWLARADSRVVGIYGSGGMATWTPPLVEQVRDVERFQVYSPNAANLAAYVDRMTAELEAEVVALDDPENVCEGADIVLGCTNSMEPVLKGNWLAPGTHITNVVPWEFGADTYARVDTVGVFLDRTPMSIAGLVDDDFSFRIQVMSWIAGSPEERERIPVGSQEADRCPKARTVLCHDWATGESYRRSDDDITYLASYANGTAEGDGGGSAGLQGLQFAAVGGRIYENARELGLGTDLPQDMFVQDIVT